jgi:hypothetical protein
MRPTLASLALCGLAAMPLAAADDTGSFAVDGVGARLCKDFTAAVAADDKSLAIAFVGWTDGFHSATNALSPETFDLTTWQTADVMIAKMRSFCTANPDEAYVNGLGQLVQVLRPDRIAAKEDIASAEWDGRTVILYQSGLQKVRDRVTDLGHDLPTPAGGFDASFATALIEVQKAAGLAETGLPDQETLIHLFEGS